VLSGDEVAFADLFTRHHAQVFRHAARTLTPADADDAMAAAFFELWRKRSKVRLVEDSVLPWLLVTVTNLCRNSARSSKRYAAALQRLPRDREADPVEEADARLQALEERRRLAHALQSLSRTDASLIALTVIDGIPPSEAAQAVGLSAGAARVRLHRARGKLRLLLADTTATSEPTAEETLR
jgi:RNA polymerase sigma-70 factor (ECF subfamily)